MTNRKGFVSALFPLLVAGSAGARVKNPDIASLYDVTLNARVVVQGTVTKIDVPRLVITLAVDKKWHGELVIDPATGFADTPQTDQEVTYECRGSIESFRVGKHVVEFLDPNLPYGTQDPKTLRAPWRPRSVRNRVLLDQPDSKDYGSFVLRYLELTQADRGRAWSSALQEHLVANLDAKDDRTRQAAGESLRDLLTMADLHGQPARELLTPQAKTAIISVLARADGQSGPPIMKLSVSLDDPQIAPAMVHGVLYLPQSGVERTDAIGKALKLAQPPTEKAIDMEFANARTDAWREYLIADLAALGGPAGEKFLWELVTKEKRAPLRKEALLAYICLSNGDWSKILGVYKKEPELEQAELLGKIAGCRGEGVREFIIGELKSQRPAVRNAAAFAASHLTPPAKEAMTVLQDVIKGCLGVDDPTLECISALDGLRSMQTPEALEALEKIEQDEKASPKLKEEIDRFLADVRQGSSGG